MYCWPPPPPPPTKQSQVRFQWNSLHLKSINKIIFYHMLNISRFGCVPWREVKFQIDSHTSHPCTRQVRGEECSPQPDIPQTSSLPWCCQQKRIQNIGLEGAWLYYVSWITSRALYYIHLVWSGLNLVNISLMALTQGISTHGWRYITQTSS